MPYPFTPIIGSSFDSIGAQTRGYAGFNAGVEEGNIARAAAAQQVQNSWLAQASQLQQAAMERDAQARAAAEAEAYRRTQDVVNQRNIERNIQIQKEQFDVSKRMEDARTKAMLAPVQFKERQEAQAIKEGETALNNAGLYYSTVYPRVSKAWEDQQSNLEYLKGRVDSFQSTVDELRGKAKPSAEDIAQLGEAKKILDQLKVRLRMAQAHNGDYTKAEKEFNALTAKMGRDGFEPTDEGTGIRHSTGKVFNFKAALDQAKAALVPPPTVATGTNPAPAAPGWAGFTGTNTVTTPAPIPALNTNTFKVGRFVVTPQ